MVKFDFLQVAFLDRSRGEGMVDIGTQLAYGEQSCTLTGFEMKLLRVHWSSAPTRTQQSCNVPARLVPRAYPKATHAILGEK